MVYSLMSEGSASLVWDLLHKLPQFKECSLFYFGTPLMISIFAGKLDTVKMLLQNLHVDVDTCAWHYDCGYEVVSPIFLATKYGHIEAVKLLLQHGSPTVFPLEPHPKWSLEQGQGQEDNHSNIIIGAANYGHADILQTLIYHGVDVDTRSSISGNTALHAAVRYGHIDSVKVLVKAGCNISPHSQGKTPLDFALNQQSLGIVQYLLDKGASFDQCLPQIFEDLEWAVGELWYPEMQKYLVTPRGGGPKSQQDIEKIACLLEKQFSLPAPHIIQAILDFAELWIVASAE
ncbi:ankyrin repeat-containing domain protein [Armillaria nabsnona]|nr:ankyrin repeat-containing domain protein [Armillaria nabsnona]